MAGREARQWPGSSEQQQQQQPGSPGLQSSRAQAFSPPPPPLTPDLPDREGGREGGGTTPLSLSLTPHLQQQQPARLSLLVLNVKVPSARASWNGWNGRQLPPSQKRTTWKKNLGSICRTRGEYHCWTLLHFQITLGTLVRSSSTSDLIFLFVPWLVSWMDKLYKYWIIPFIKPSVDIYQKNKILLTSFPLKTWLTVSGAQTSKIFLNVDFTFAWYL